jgi:hypothetical protein
MPEYPYSTHLNILKGPLETIDVGRLADECQERWWNQTLCQVNASVVRLGVVQGEYTGTSTTRTTSSSTSSRERFSSISRSARSR